MYICYITILQRCFRASQFSKPHPSIVTHAAGPAVEQPLSRWPGSRNEPSAVRQLRCVSGVTARPAGIPTVVVCLCTHQTFEEVVELSLQEQPFAVGLFEKNVGALCFGCQSLGSPFLADHARELPRRLDRGQEAGDDDDRMSHDEGGWWGFRHRGHRGPPRR